MYIYIYIERERERNIYIYTLNYMVVSVTLGFMLSAFVRQVKFF